jgi:hypothetical protein
MTKRAKPNSVVANPVERPTLSSVKLGHYAVLADGRTARVAAVINGAVFVRFYRDGQCIDAPLTGPVELDAATPVLDIIAPELVASDRSAVVDPLAKGAA